MATIYSNKAVLNRLCVSTRSWKKMQKQICFARFYTSTDRFQTVLQKHVFLWKVHHSRAVCLVLRFMSKRAPKRAKNKYIFTGLWWCVVGVSLVILRSSSCALRACSKSFEFYEVLVETCSKKGQKPVLVYWSMMVRGGRIAGHLAIFKLRTASMRKILRVLRVCSCTAAPEACKTS